MSDLKSLLGSTPSTSKLVEHLTSLSPPSPLAPEIKSYPDAVYYNYYTLGLSLQFTPVDGYKPKTGATQSGLNAEKLKLSSIDLYNVLEKFDGKDKKSDGKKLVHANYSPYPAYPLVIPLSPDSSRKADKIDIVPTSTGKDFVSSLGEPTRKGGGAGPSSGSIGIWCEWTKDGIMVEFGGDEARGPQAWERGKDAIWNVITLFEKKKD